MPSDPQADDSRAIADAYLAALGLQREPPSLAALTAVTRRHVAEFPFASIGPRLGTDLPLDPASLLDRIVLRRRGGYCFEQNGLVFHVLSDLGYSPRLALARVILDRDTLTGLTHRISLVDLDGQPHVVDVGFGPLGPREPVPLTGGQEPDAAGHSVVEHSPGVHHVRTAVDAAPRSLYRFELVDYGDADCELGHFYSHRHPQAVFVNNFVASRILDGEVRSLRNREYWVIHADDTTRTVITSPDELRGILVDELGLNVTPDEAARLFDEAPAPSA